MGWHGPTITDSGGFQVLSLGVGFKKILAMDARSVRSDDVIAEGKDRLAHVDDDGVTFKSHLDGSMHRFTPEVSMQVQHQIGADIMFAFDECTTLLNTREYQERSVARTQGWAERCVAEHERLTVAARASPVPGAVRRRPGRPVRGPAPAVRARPRRAAPGRLRHRRGPGEGPARHDRPLGVRGAARRTSPVTCSASARRTTCSRRSRRGRTRSTAWHRPATRATAPSTTRRRASTSPTGCTGATSRRSTTPATATPARTTRAPTCTTCSRRRRWSPRRSPRSTTSATSSGSSTASGRASSTAPSTTCATTCWAARLER